MAFLPSSMQPSNRAKLLPLLLCLALALPAWFQASARAADSSGQEQATAPAASAAGQPPEPLPPETADDTTSVQRQYPEDPTGVRARLGLCRKGQDGPGGGGHHRRFRGGGMRWNGQ